MSFYSSFSCLKKAKTISDFSVFYLPKVIDLKYITVTYLFKMTKFMWVNISCLCV